MKDSELSSGVTFGRVREERSGARTASVLTWPLWRNGRWRSVALAVVMVALLVRGLVLSSPLVLSGDAQARYVPLANNLWQGHGYSRQMGAPFRPDSFDQPGYPAFLAAALDFGRGSLTLVAPLQMALEIAIVALVFAITGAAGLPRTTRLGALAIALLCPFLPLWSGRAMSEILTTFCLSVLCFLCVQAARDDAAHPDAKDVEIESTIKINWWLCAGIAGAMCLMVRADTLPSVVLMLLSGALAHWLHKRRRAKRLNFQIHPLTAFNSQGARSIGGLTVALVALAVLLVPWTWRNYQVFGEFLPLGRVGEQQRNGYVVWLGTWVDDTRYHKPLWWDILKPDHDIRFPETKIPDPLERQLAIQGVQLARKRKMFAGDASQLFFGLAARARHDEPLQVHLVVPFKRTAMTWLRMADYTPISAVRGFARDPDKPHNPRPHEQFLIALIGYGWYGLLGLALLGVACAIYQRRWLCAPLLALIAGRSLLPFVSGIGTEPRYMIEALPAVFVFGALGVTAIWPPLRDKMPIVAKTVLQVLARVFNPKFWINSMFVFLTRLTMFSLVLPVLMFSFASVQAAEPTAEKLNPQLPQVTITVRANQQESVSRFQLGVTHTQRDLDTVVASDEEGLARAKNLLSRVISYHNVHIMGWGTDNPNPAPGVYNWDSLDRRMAMVRSTPNAVPIITLCAAPDWMKGGEAGKTEWKNIEVAPTPEHFADFARLAAIIAKRYPDTRYFQVWNEMKGLWKADLNNWDYIGYTELYNQCYRALKEVNPKIQVGGPYLVIEGTGGGKLPASDATSAPLTPRNAQVIDYWLQHKVGADFIVLDRGLQSYHDKNTYSASELMNLTSQFGNIARQIRTKTDLPIWWAEYYPNIPGGPQAIAAAHAATLAQMARNDSSVALLWQPMESGEIPAALISDVRKVSGGRALPLWDVYRIFHDDFPPGTSLVAATSSSPDVQVLASPERTLLINTGEQTLVASVNGVPYALGRYDVRSVPTP